MFFSINFYDIKAIMKAANINALSIENSCHCHPS